MLERSSISDDAERLNRVRLRCKWIFGQAAMVNDEFTDIEQRSDDGRKLTYDFHNTRPIELFDFSAAMHGLADEYKRFVQSSELTDAEARLYIREMRKGSLVADLVAYAPLAAGPLLTMTNTVTVLDFGNYLRSLIQYLLPGGNIEKVNPPPSKQSLDNISKLVEPVVKDEKATLNITVSGLNNTVVIVDRMNSLTANALQNSAKRLRAQIDPGAGRHEKVLMYWHQARNDLGQTGDKAIIESLSSKAIRTIFVDPAQKRLSLAGDKNPFRAGLIVDVDVETRQGKPALYKIVQVHEVLDEG